jgi:uncharacterized membrane protein HdeD (DUF308 family)
MSEPTILPPFPGAGLPPKLRDEIRHELHHLRDHWWWLTLLGALLVIGGTAAIVVPTLTVVTTLAAVIVLGVTLMVSGVAVIVAAFWTGKWSGFLLQILVGLLYLMAGFAITEQPGEGAVAATLLLASFFIVLGVFRVIAALTAHLPQWGWVLLNGVVTLLLGVVIYKHFPQSVPWVIGLLVGIEMLFNGWTWIMLSLALRSIPKDQV